MTRLVHTPLVRVSLVALSLVLAAACNKGDSGDAPAAVAAEAEVAVHGELGTDAFVEEHEEGSVAWRIDSDGQVKAAVLASAGARIKEDIAGTLVYKVGDAEAKTVPLVLDAKTGLLVAAGPKLEADLTEVAYTVTVSGKPWSGVLHVPAGGTVALVAGAKATAEAKLPSEAVGPHGGTIQIVGGDRLEMVADASGETRVYVLDVDLRPVRVEARTLRMGFVAQTTTFVSFAPEPAGFYFVAMAPPAIVLNPLRVTAALTIGGAVHAAIWGFRPGVRIYAPTAILKIATAPRLQLVLKGGFDGGFDVYGRAHTRVAVRDDDDGKKGNNGRHFGQDGTWDRDSDGDPKGGKGHGGKAKGGGHDDDSKGGGHSSAGHSKGGGHDDSKGGGKSAGVDKGGGGKGNGGGGKSAGVDKGGGGKGNGGGGGKSSGGGGKSSGGGSGKGAKK